MFWSSRLGIMHFSLFLHCISLYQVLEFPLEILEVLGSIWDQKGSGKCCLGEQSTRAGYGSDVRHPLQKNRRLARRLAPRWYTRSKPNFLSTTFIMRSDLWQRRHSPAADAERPLERRHQPARVLERWSMCFGATYGSDLVHPRRVLSYVENLCFIWASEVIN